MFIYFIIMSLFVGFLPTFAMDQSVDKESLNPIERQLFRNYYKTLQETGNAVPLEIFYGEPSKGQDGSVRHEMQNVLRSRIKTRNSFHRAKKMIEEVGTKNGS